ncbi:MAG: hypothetical protein RLZZ126_1626 [Pseudomonadota bacterium]|jgi:hydroxysqualene dehydroxylase
MHVGVIGAGWAGLACAVRATQLGHQVTVLEASDQLGGRARSAHWPGHSGAPLDNGQHILIGAYTQTLELMRVVGMTPDTHFLRCPLTLKWPDGGGIELPDWPPPLDLAAGVLRAHSWTLADKLSLLRVGSRWGLEKFTCADHFTVNDICHGLTPRIRDTLIEPLCVSALNTPPERASAAVFLRVLRDALIGGRGSSNYLLPRQDLSSLFPLPAVQWLKQAGQTVLRRARVPEINLVGKLQSGPWKAHDLIFDHVAIATDPSNAMRLLQGLTPMNDKRLMDRTQAWSALVSDMTYEGMGTVYVQCDQEVRLPHPILALKNGADIGPAQFVFDRGQLTGHHGLLSFVISACTLTRADAELQVLEQARSQLGLRHMSVHAIIEKRATFACTPALKRPSMQIAPGLWACGDYVDGPYPATLEGAVRSGIAVAEAVASR